MMNEQEVLTRLEGLTRVRLQVCIRESWVNPAQTDAGPVFDDLDLARLRLISELIDDFSVGDDAVPIILSLIDQIHGLKRRMRMLDKAILTQGEAVRAEIAKCIDQFGAGAVADKDKPSA